MILSINCNDCSSKGQFEAFKAIFGFWQKYWKTEKKWVKDFLEITVILFFKQN